MSRNGVDWHAMDLPSLLRAVDATEQGLSDPEAAGRLLAFGPNRLPEEPAPSRWQVLLRQFRSPLIAYVFPGVGRCARGDPRRHV